MVAGRFLQGVGGGGLVPATLALVADLWPPERRGLPSGSSVRSRSSAACSARCSERLVLAVADWRAIFWLNTAVGLVLAAAILACRGEARPAGSVQARPQGRPDMLGMLLLAAATVVLAVIMREPRELVTDVTYGLAFLPLVGESRWLSPLALGLYALLALFVLRQATARRPLLQWRSWPATARLTDLPGALLLGLALAGIILAFAAADPEVHVLSPAGPYLLGGSAVALGLFVWRQVRARHPLVPRGALAARPAWGSIAVSFAVGAALIAALVDIPFFARLTAYPDSQLDAALVLVRFLAALPVGALIGGWLTRWVDAAWLASGAMLMAAAGFIWMSTWGRDTLDSGWATVPLVLAGLGFGGAIAPVNAALLARTRSDVHGVASALLVVARMVGMLVGISALTTVGLRRFYAVAADIPPIEELCEGSRQRCVAYDDALLEAGLAQLEAIFLGASLCALLAAVLAAVTLRGAPTRDTPAHIALGAAG
jgi:MFS family permease